MVNRIFWNFNGFGLSFWKSGRLLPSRGTLACVAGGISHASAFILVPKLNRVPRVELKSRLPKFVGFFELCVHQCTRISDWLRVLKRQSNVNRYLSSVDYRRPRYSRLRLWRRHAHWNVMRFPRGFSSKRETARSLAFRHTNDQKCKCWLILFMSGKNNYCQFHGIRRGVRLPPIYGNFVHLAQNIRCNTYIF